jgi:arabinose-5-phosphate isomerase
MNFSKNNPIKIAQEVLRAEADSIYGLMDQLDDNFSRAIDLIMKQPGRVLVLGVGKSGHIGKKIAATLASTGQPSFFIHPTEAIHGDVGMMVRGDTCLLISHSGNTSELLETIPAIKRIGLPIISITSNHKSKLARYSDVVLNTHVKEEACPFNLAPTTSTTVTLAYADAIAICLLKLRGFNEEQFAMCHPGGVLGKRLLTKVCDIMISENLPISHEKDTFKQALATMTKGRQGVTIIVDDNSKCIGILTDGDLRRIFEKYDRVSEIKLEDIYSRNPKMVHHDALATEALKTMQDNKITSLIVVDHERETIGLLHIHHLLEQGFY